VRRFDAVIRNRAYDQERHEEQIIAAWSGELAFKTGGSVLAPEALFFDTEDTEKKREARRKTKNTKNTRGMVRVAGLSPRVSNIFTEGCLGNFLITEDSWITDSVSVGTIKRRYQNCAPGGRHLNA